VSRSAVLFGVAACRDVTIRQGDDYHYHLPPLPAAAVAEQLIIGEIPREPLAFQGRAQTAQAIERALTTGGIAVVHALAGGPGVGKTQIAGAVARKRISEGCALVGWVGADTVDLLLTDLATIADRIGVADPEGDSATSARRLREHLEGRQEEALLVIDNATDPDAVGPLLPVAGRTQVIITSTDRAFESLGELVDVDVFTREESVRYLHERTGLDDSHSADELAATLGDLPLALAQAAAVIKARRQRYSQYLEQLQTVPIAHLLTQRAGEPYRRGAAEAILLALQAAEEADRTGTLSRVLETIAVLSGEGVPLDFLQTLDEQTADEHLCQVGAAVETGIRFSILAWAGTGDTVVMHRMIARVVRDRATGAGRRGDVLDQAAKVITAALVPESQAWQRREQARHLPEQIAALWDAGRDAWSTEPPADERTLTVLGLRQWALQHLLNTADLTRARAWGEATLTKCEHILGSDHTATLGCRNNLAGAYWESGDLGRAVPLLQATVADCERLLGHDHPLSFIARNNLAGAYRESGDLGRAIPLLEVNLVERERVCGLDHPDTLTSRNNLAGAYRESGDLGRAIPLFQTTVADCERLLGHDHPHTLSSRNNLARAYQASGDLGRAIPLLEVTLADRERVFGLDHPDTLISRGNLAGAYEASGDLGRAIPLLEATAADCERLLGHDHPHTLSAGNDLASAYQASGDLGRAIPLLEVTLADRERVFGLDHPDTLISRGNLAGAYEASGDLGRAISLQEATAADRERLLGYDHPHTLTARGNLGTGYLLSGNLARAVPLLQATLVDCERILGHDHPGTLISRGNLASAYQASGDLGRAIHLLEATAADCERILGPDHPKTLTARNKVARAYVDSGDLSRAIPLLEATAADRERILGPDHPKTLMSRYDLAYAYQASGDLGRAIPLYQTTLADCQRVLGPHHPGTQLVRRNAQAALDGPNSHA
jgi:tetratricopeptide (TPR) repeat protein